MGPMKGTGPGKKRKPVVKRALPPGFLARTKTRFGEPMEAGRIDGKKISPYDEDPGSPRSENHFLGFFPTAKIASFPKAP